MFLKKKIKIIFSIYKMSLVYDKNRLEKITQIFKKHSQGRKHLPNKKIVKFWEDMGIGNDLFLSDFYYYYPEVQKGADLTYDDCLAFIDYILTPKNSNKEIMEAFKMFDKNGIGHINTTQLLGHLKKEVSAQQFQRYSSIILAYGPSINYIDQFQNKNNC